MKKYVSLLIREFSGKGNNFESVSQVDKLVNLNEGTGDGDDSLQGRFLAHPQSILVDIEAIHGYPYATRNFTRYMAEALKGSVESWTSPYRRPMILFHNEQDGDIVGRVVAANYVTRKTKSGTPALILTVNIADPEAIQKVKNGILETTSIGVMANTVKCSVCGQDITTEGLCEHERGETYDGKVCYWDIYDMEGKECSYVIVPSDIYSGNIKIYKPSGEQKEDMIEVISSSISIKEGYDAGNHKEKDAEGKKKTTMTDEEKKALQEAQDALAAAEKANKELKEQVAAIEADKASAEEKATNAETALKEEQDAHVATKQSLEESTANLETEKALRVTLEEQLQTEEKKQKQDLVEKVFALRKTVGKAEIKLEALQERSLDSLNDSIADLEEELRGKHFPAGDSTVVDPTLHESEDEKKNNNNNKVQDVNLKESLEGLIDEAYRR